MIFATSLAQKSRVLTFPAVWKRLPQCHGNPLRKDYCQFSI